MAVSIREAQATDAAECGRIIHAAFAAIATQHKFPPDFPSVDVATGVASMLMPILVSMASWLNKTDISSAVISSTLAP
jgi:hypothetical protein